MNVRLAEENELDRINELRRQVNEIHVAERPDIFTPGFPPELQERIHVIWNDPEQDIVVAELNGQKNIDSLKHYLQLDSDRMRSCGLSLSEVGLTMKGDRYGNL